MQSLLWSESARLFASNLGVAAPCGTRTGSALHVMLVWECLPRHTLHINVVYTRKMRQSLPCVSRPPTSVVGEARHRAVWRPRAACPLDFLLSFARHLRYKGPAGSTVPGLSPTRLLERRRSGDDL